MATAKKGMLSYYTTWTYFKKWLEKGIISFSSYIHWDDKSDVILLEAYERKIKKQVRVLCFMDMSSSFKDSFYHWKYYAKDKKDNDTTYGIRVDFNKKLLLKYLGKDKKEARNVDYPDNKNLKAKAKNPDNWPFLKRASYEADNEFRIIYVEEGTKKFKKGQPLEIKFNNFKECIERVTLGPDFPEKNVKEIEDSLLKYGKKLSRSKILGYNKWETMVIKQPSNNPILWEKEQRSFTN